MYLPIWIIIFNFVVKHYEQLVDVESVIEVFYHYQ